MNELEFRFYGKKIWIGGSHQNEASEIATRNFIADGEDLSNGFWKQDPFECEKFYWSVEPRNQPITVSFARKR